MNRLFLAATAVAIASATGCVSYQAEPLNHRALIDQIDHQRSEPEPPVASPAGTLTLTDAAIWMTRYNPEVRELRAEYAALADVAAIPTPFPNPGVEAGLTRGFRLDESVASKTQPFIGMGFAIPLGPRLEATDDLHAAEAEAARVKLVARHRELYMDLHVAYWRYALAVQRRQAHQQLIDISADFLATVEALAKRGVGTGLDAGIARVDLVQLRLEQTEYDEELDAVRSELATITGVAAERFAALDVPSGTPPALLPQAEFSQSLATHQPALARLAAAYEVAERALRLEIAHQYPDLELGWEADQEVGEKTRNLGLSVGIEIPLFDRNQQGIAAAVAARRQARVAYEAEVARILASADALYVRDRRLQARLAIIQDELLPQAQQNLADADRLMQAGRLDAMRYIELERGARELRVAALDLTRQRHELALDLGALLGLPLMAGSDESSNPTGLVIDSRVTEGVYTK